jgi:hypothetical protein
LSHIVTIETEVRDLRAIQSACARLDLPAPHPGDVQFLTGKVSGLLVHLTSWRFPVVCQLQSGALKYDNYEGRWGDRAHLERFLQAYSVEKARLEARRAGHTVTEQPLEDGSIKLTIHVGGAAA